MVGQDKEARRILVDAKVGVKPSDRDIGTLQDYYFCF